MIVLPWPDKRLSPNARQHWAVLGKVKAKARLDARLLTLAAPIPIPLPFIGERLPMRVTFHQPDNRHRDADNMIAATKAAQDGIADALGVDDRCFAPLYVFGDVVKGGKITVEIGV